MSQYSGATEAILELVDNSIDERIEGRLLKVDISVSRGRIEVADCGGRGMGRKELETFMEWGRSDKRGRLGRYGLGGKAALGYLGRSWKLVTCKEGADLALKIVEAHWDDEKGGLKEYELRRIALDERAPQGATRFVIEDLKKSVNAPPLRGKLGSIYRPLLMDGEVDIRVNGRRVEHLQLPLAEAPEEFEEVIGSGQVVRGWIGVLDTTKIEKRGDIPGGLRCYAYGRLITEGEFFGHPGPAWKAALNRLIGEVHLDFVPLTTNKTNFDRDSEEWKRTTGVIEKQLRPFIERLARSKEAPVTKREKEAARRAMDLLQEVARKLQRAEFLSGLMGAARGRKRPEPREKTVREDGEREPTSRKPPEPRTVPPQDAVGRLIRLGQLPKVKYTNTDEVIRSALHTKNGATTVLVNRDFPAFRARSKTVDDLTLYVFETAVMEVLKKPNGTEMTATDAFEEFNAFLREASKALLRGKRH